MIQLFIILNFILQLKLSFGCIEEALGLPNRISWRLWRFETSMEMGKEIFSEKEKYFLR